jgi:predicted component of type VI protein secretion system
MTLGEAPMEHEDATQIRNSLRERIATSEARLSRLVAQNITERQDREIESLVMDLDEMRKVLRLIEADDNESENRSAGI